MSRDPEVVPYPAVNQFWHAGRLPDASYRDGGSPSTDTLYSLAWLDLHDEPVILSHPEMGERYFTVQLAGSTSDNFGYVGQRTTGTAAVDFAIVGPEELPPVDGFWSLAAYTADDLNLILNPGDLYSVGNRAENLTRAEDGGLTLYLQPEASGSGADENWLPTSATHPWFLILRMYRPGLTVVDGGWRCPAVSRVDVNVHASTS